MHKFSYLPETQAMPGCVGCGRCVTECPVNLDIREVVTSLSEGNAR
jgi:ferredoxin